MMIFQFLLYQAIICAYQSYYEYDATGCLESKLSYFDNFGGIYSSCEEHNLWGLYENVTSECDSTNGIYSSAIFSDNKCQHILYNMDSADFPTTCTKVESQFSVGTCDTFIPSEYIHVEVWNYFCFGFGPNCESYRSNNYYIIPGKCMVNEKIDVSYIFTCQNDVMSVEYYNDTSCSDRVTESDQDYNKDECTFAFAHGMGNHYAFRLITCDSTSEIDDTGKGFFDLLDNFFGFKNAGIMVIVLTVVAILVLLLLIIIVAVVICVIMKKKKDTNMGFKELNEK